MRHRRVRRWAAALTCSGALIFAGCTTTPPMKAAASTAAPTAERPLSLIPWPAQLEHRDGSLHVGGNTPVVAAASSGSARYLVDLVQRTRGLSLVLDEAASTTAPAIRFTLDATAPAGDEAYALDIDTGGVRVRARTEAGLFYGGITLWQLLTRDGGHGDTTLPALHIEDAPRFVWRGVMLDVARHFRSTEEVKHLIDAMAQHKLNVFHWHLTDDQGWRIEIKRYPKLTQTGGCRIPAGAAGRDAHGKPAPYCGYYTQEQIRDVVAYAAARHIRVVPEIEMPGHAQAAIAAYPQLGVTGKQPPVSSDWGVHTWLYNVDDSTFEFLQNVLAEVVELFPGEFVHVGGDEAAKDQWAASPRVQARRKALQLPDDAHLQAWFIARMEQWLGAHDRRLIGWDEILEGGLPPRATVMSWRGTQGAIDAARQGHDVVLAPSPIVYFDNLQSLRHDEPTGRGAEVSLHAVYDFEAVPAELDAAQAQHVLGAQANLWTEHLRTAERVEHAAFPRAAALAEALWTPRERRDWHSFSARMAPQFARYRATQFAAADSAFAVAIAAQAQTDGHAMITLSSQENVGTLRYTTDGTEPTPQSPAYNAPFRVAVPAQIAAVRFDGTLPLGAVRSERIDAERLSTRYGDELVACKPGLMLRLEDDAPRDGPRAVLNTDIFDPCWLWRGELPQGAVTLRARVGQLPYNFQLWRDIKSVVERPSALPQGELQVHAAACDGPVLARVSLAAAQHEAALSTLQAPLQIPVGTNVLCLQFATGKHDPMWSLERVQILPATH